MVNQSAQSIENELYIRLVTPLGSYWADRTLGSRLHELRRQKHLKRIEVLAKQYAEQALQPVIQSKRAQSIQVTASAPQHGWLKLHIEAVDAAGDTVNRAQQRRKIGGAVGKGRGGVDGQFCPRPSTC